MAKEEVPEVGGNIQGAFHRGVAFLTRAAGKADFRKALKHSGYLFLATPGKMPFVPVP